MSNMNIDLSFVTDLSRDLVSLASGCTVKRNDLARKYENLQTLNNFDYYLNAYTKTSTFEGFDTFDDDIMIAAGLTSVEIELARLSKLNIPEEKRMTLVNLQRDRVLVNFQEKNNYYRSLMGLPNMEDPSYLFVSGPISGVDTTKPIHAMTDDEIAILDNLGKIAELKTKHPFKRYLNYLGTNKIDLIIARNARNFEIIKAGIATNEAIERRFLYNYEIARTYILNNYYKTRHSKDLTYYDSYIGFLIMILTIILTIDESVKVLNYKEYYNELVIKEILQSYNLNIFDDIPLIYRAKIAHNIESLIVSKGTDEVIFKILKIFGFDDISIRKFYLVKEHKKNNLEEYIFEYEEDGVTPKYEEMYDVYFSQIDILSTNIDAEIRKSENKIVYEDVTDRDIYWGGRNTADQVRIDLLKENFNYLDTDYISINTAYTLSEISFEVSYFFSTVLSLKPHLDRLKLIEPLLGTTVNLFYMITMLSALVSKKYNFDGNIITNPAHIATINRFNFESLTSEITNILNKHKYQSPEIYSIMTTASLLENKGQLLNIYMTNKTIHDKLLSLKSKTKDLNEYLAINEIMEYLTTSKMNSDIYKKADGTVATTYLDYLSSYNAAVSNYINKMTLADVDDAIFSILVTLEDYIGGESFKNLFLRIPMTTGENTVRRYMKKVLNIFKALTINIFSMTTTYNVDDTRNTIKIIDKERFEGNQFNHVGMSMIDTAGFNATFNKEEQFKFRDEIELVESYR